LTLVVVVGGGGGGGAAAADWRCTVAVAVDDVVVLIFISMFKKVTICSTTKHWSKTKVRTNF
jgi:hypothetical protein